MKKRTIIVIDASVGGIEAFQQLMAHLSANLDAAIFIVWHMALGTSLATKPVHYHPNRPCLRQRATSFLYRASVTRQT